MYLKELEIFGFKSFPDKTILKFEQGITVVVGPNGCGKSNVFDAIKWSLGEQSPKSLRGTKMEDVIFNGTEHHPPLNYTEVILTFCNEDNYLPIDFKEVAITRRLYRSGESQYFINKNIVRLKDVADLFMGTGVGEATYSFIEQGKIEMFLSYKPEDKRLIFDEASGIIKFKERKREALRRMKETEENLLRLEDILHEVRRQARYLQRQVDKARKYKEIQERLLEVEKRISAYSLADLENRSKLLLDELANLKAKEEEEDSALKAAGLEQDNLDARLRDLRKLIEQRMANIVSLRAQVENSYNHTTMCNTRIAELKERNTAIIQAQDNHKKRLNIQEERGKEEKLKLEAIELELSQQGEQELSLRQENIDLANEIEAASRGIKQKKAEVFECENAKTQMHNSLIEIQAHAGTLAKRRQRLLLDRVKLEELIKEKEETLKKANVELGSSKEYLDSLRDKKNILGKKEKEITACKEEIKGSIVDKEKEIIGFRSSYDFLKDLHIKYDNFPVRENVTIIFHQEPKNINKLVVSLKNISFQKDGDVYKADVSAKIISLDEGQLKDKIELLDNEIKTLNSRLQTICGEFDLLVSQVEKTSEELKGEESKFQGVLKEQEGLIRDQSRLCDEFGLLDRELQSAENSLHDLDNQQSQQKQKLEHYEQQFQNHQQQLSSLHETVSRCSQRLQEIDVEIARKEAEKDSIQKEMESLKSRTMLITEEKNNIIKSLEELSQEFASNEQKIRASNDYIEKLEAKIDEDGRSIESLTAQKTHDLKQEADLLKELDEKKKLSQNLEAESQEIKKSVYNKKLDTQSLDYEKDKIYDYMRQVYQVEILDTSHENIEESKDVLFEEKEKLLKSKQSLGEVNLVAIEEFDELRKREEFLEGQKNDLITSKNDLKKAIMKINHTCRDLFMETFVKIQEEFKKNFKFLFNGGRAQLILLDPDNVLDSGVEIEVQPPGKKLQNVSLLSGGEKALTAISLIFAIFRVKPSPLCVLDEIDAPLDEANVDRFNYILKEFAAFSQFIVITHNKRTMSNADVLYGVTMQEKGISKLVSVKFAEQEASPA
ncbi:MAG: AAA family ATPase [Candidatus Omnitrophota bacterium]